MNIIVNKNNVVIEPRTLELLNKGEYNVTDLQFQFSEEYTGLPKMAVFSNAFGTYETAITNNGCIIPYEVLSKKGVLTIGVYGYTIDNDVVVKRYSPKPASLNISDGSYIPNASNPQQENPTAFEEFMQQLETDIDNINESKQDVLTAGNNIEIDNNVISAIVPTDNSQLTNGAGYITKDVNNLTNYTKTIDFNQVAFTGSYEDLTQTPTKLSEFENDEDYQTYNDVEDMISALGSVFTLKGTVNTVADLPQTNNKQGDVWYVKSESAGYVWLNDNGTYRWEILGYTVDTSDFITKSGLDQSTGQDTDNTMSQKAITDQLNTKQATINSSNKLSADLVNDTSSTNKFVTSAEKETWNNKSDFSGNYNDLTNKPDLTIYEEKTDAEEKYNTLLAQIPTATATGETINVQDSSNLPPKDFAMLGNATQADTPTPDTPQDIHVVTGDNTVKVLGKNLFNNLDTYYYRNKNYNLTINGNTISFTNNYTVANNYIWWNIPVVVGQNLTISYSNMAELTGNDNNRVSYHFSDVPNTTSGTPPTITGIISKQGTITATAKYLILILRTATGVNGYTISDLMVEVGNTATPYTSYIAPTTQLLSLGSIELAKIGDYTDRIFKAVQGNSIYDSLDSTTKASLTVGSWYKQGNIGKKLLVGDENEVWSSGSISTNELFCRFRCTDIDGLSKANSTFLSNKFIYIGTLSGLGCTQEGLYNTAASSRFYLWIDKTRVAGSTSNDIRNWLSNNNVLAYYILATPTYTEITDTILIAQLENILAMHTNKNVTNAWIEPSGTNAQASLTLTYYRDLQTITDKIDSLEARVSLLE